MGGETCTVLRLRLVRKLAMCLNAILMTFERGSSVEQVEIEVIVPNIKFGP